jgi:glutathione synthase/RimK-type ligase-like ATP-grasp enzyme
MILIVTNSADLHADLLVPLLAAKGCPHFRLNLDAFPRDYQIQQTVDTSGMQAGIVHLPSGKAVQLGTVGATWVRKAADFVFPSADLAPQEQAYARQETEHALFGLLYSMDCYWMSHPLAVRGALWKGEQLLRARRMGFRVPASLVTNSPDQVRAFKASIAGDLIFKSMSSPLLGSDQVSDGERITAGIGTTLITDDMMESLESVSELACHFQEYIPKQYELRITVIGGRIFAARIYSQADSRTAVDSRDMSAPVKYEACTLPDDIQRRCLQFIGSYGLNYGALDFIVTPDGEYVFLENNPGGQFWYVQQLIPEFKMLEALANQLITEAECRRQSNFQH